jgi:hypothetical protein
MIAVLCGDKGRTEMKRWAGVLAGGFVLVLASVGQASAEPNAENASCMGLGSSFYGQFAPEQRAFVSQIVNEIAMEAGIPPGETYSTFGQEKEGGSIPPPCGTRLE